MYNNVFVEYDIFCQQETNVKGIVCHSNYFYYNNMLLIIASVCKGRFLDCAWLLL